MKIYKALIAACAINAFYIGNAVAGPPATVTFKNYGTQTATFTPTTNNEAITKANATPTPKTAVTANGSDIYIIESLISPEYNHANLRYQSGRKKCVFLATFVTTVGPGATKIPKWNNSASPAGGAICTIRVTGRNLTTYAWSVEITMR